MNISSDSTKLVSVIMPCFNMERFLDRAIRSVVNQTHSNMELILIDDCSRDSSWEIANKWSKEYAWIRVLKTSKNLGPSQARNIGLDNASGEFIAFLDADDYMYPNRLERQVELLESTDYSLCYSAYQRVDENEKVLGKVSIEKFKLTYRSLLGDPCICISTLTIAKYKIADFPRFEQGLKKAEDYYLYLSLVKQGYTAIGINTPLVNYSVVKGSLSRQGLGCLPDMYKIYTKYEHKNQLVSCLLILKYLVKAAKRRSLLSLF